jgi:hypothetical protein
MWFCHSAHTQKNKHCRRRRRARGPTSTALSAGCVLVLSTGRDNVFVIDSFRENFLFGLGTAIEIDFPSYTGNLTSFVMDGPASQLGVPVEVPVSGNVRKFSVTFSAGSGDSVGTVLVELFRAPATQTTYPPQFFALTPRVFTSFVLTNVTFPFVLTQSNTVSSPLVASDRLVGLIYADGGSQVNVSNVTVNAGLTFL